MMKSHAVTYYVAGLDALFLSEPLSTLGTQTQQRNISDDIFVSPC